MYTIIGKGFGLYGYLPAIMMNQSNLVLSSEYKLNIEKRKDINQYINRIKWTQSIEESIHLSNNIILAIPPKEQFKFLHEKETNISNKTIFLEKPIASSPKESFILLKFLEEKKIKFYVNYSFIYLDWFKNLYHKINSLKPDAVIKITWEFKAHFLMTNFMNWKSDFKLGGGILRFYGIHLMAVLTALNYENCKIIKLKNNALQKQLFSYISGGAKSPKFLVDKYFIENNRKLNIEFINLNKFYKKNNEFTIEEIKTFINENSETLKQDFIDFSYVIITPKNLIGVDEFNQTFFDAIDEIDNKISKNVDFKSIINEMKIDPITKKDYANLENENTIESKIYNSRKNKIEILEDQGTFIFYQIEKITTKLPKLDNDKYLKQIKNLANQCRCIGLRQTLRDLSRTE